MQKTAMRWAGLATTCAIVAGAAGQDTGPGNSTPRADNAVDLLELMRNQGYDVPSELTSNADGSVSVPEKADADAFDPNDIWTNRFELSFSSTQGNSEQSNLRLGYTGTRETEDNKLSLDASYYYAESESDVTNDQATAGAQYEWYYEDSKWSPFVTGRWDYDSFQSWEYRIQLFTGLGYIVYKSDKQELIARAGVGVTREFNSSRNEWIPEALLGVDYSLQFTDRQSFEFEGRYFPSLLDFSEFRATAKLGYRFDLETIAEGLSLTAGVEFEHQSETDPGIENNDVLLYAGVGLDF